MEHALRPTIHQSSPLDTLVRRTSSRRGPLTIVTPVTPITPPRPGDATASGWAQDSPILHTRFRTSTTTSLAYSDHGRSGSDAHSTFSWAAKDDSFSEDQQSRGLHPLVGARPGQNTRGEILVESVYSQVSHDRYAPTGSYRDSSGTPKQREPPWQPSEEAVPIVVVSDEPDQQSICSGWPAAPSPPSQSNTGRMPSRVEGGINFSRPNLPHVDRSDGRKREVLRRNQQRTSPSQPGSSHQPGRSPLGQYEQHADSSRPSTSMSMNSRDTPSPQPPSVRSVSPNAFHNPRSQPPHAVENSAADMQLSVSSSTSAPPPRPQRPSHLSLYSAYSYYPPDAVGALPPSPNDQTSQKSLSPSSLSPNYVPGSRSPTATSTPLATDVNNPHTPQDYLQLGIQHHEANRLVESAVCFEKSATLQGGCPVGMLMWGLTQRHGWGCAKSEQAGFRWLRRAAEVAVEDLEGSRQGMDAGAVKTELVLAIYEVGQSFLRGWGVEKDKAMGVSYFRVAARLGDPDAQQELAFCLANGKGCKKDKKEAAKWYRAAVAQGVSDVGLAWIYKEKYQ
ncbi:uncharacterized protein FIBRA_08611 [Fibroporia radiculosa]|uniref:HCP-like protein n=1 Tax=Fibroporia radiculosa TaxID=599839 RepID=J4H596_9APHY|nr:uncharacterized protein FIBRA_08611 [Fibroporia radiculosa]CCM06354.1 predicted protein [Fibroporia radiculosa]